MRRAVSPVPWHAQLMVTLLVVIITEQLLRVFITPGAHVFAQRQAEAYGWLSMAALLLVLLARALRLLPYRRALGLAAFAFGLAHTWLSYQHVLGGDVENVLFLSVADQAAVWLGVIALLGLLPLALTSTNAAMRRLGPRWRTLHKLGPPMTLLAAAHTAWIGVHFGLNPPAWTSVVLLLLTLALVVFRRRLHLPFPLERRPHASSNPEHRRAVRPVTERRARPRPRDRS